MKRILILLLLLAVASFVFADDALVLPKGVLRTYITGAYGFAQADFPGSFGDRNQHDIHNSDAADNQRNSGDARKHVGKSAANGGGGG